MTPPIKTAKNSTIKVVESKLIQILLSTNKANIKHIKNGPHKSQFLT